MPAMRIEATKAGMKPVDLDMGHEPGGDEQRQAHEEDREDAGDHDVRLREGEEEDRPHRERDEARDDGHQERREQDLEPVALEAGCRAGAARRA